MKTAQVRCECPDIELWCWENIGHGGAALRTPPGCEGFEDWWDGDLWKIDRCGMLGAIFCFKEEKDYMLFMLRWL
jgi:hypothetical protein